MCADTQETVGDYKNYVEKITIVEDLTYPLAVGGAGFGDLIDVSIDEIIEQVKEKKPPSKLELKALLNGALKKIYEEDLPTLVVPKQHRSPQLLIAARTANDGFCIFPTKGRRVLPEVRRTVIGYQTAYNIFLLKRFHRETLSMQQAVMLAVYLVMRSKALDEGVGGETRVAVVVNNGAWIDDPEYIAKSEDRVKEFLQLADSLFLDSVDLSIPPSEFTRRLDEFRQKVTQVRENYLRYTTQRTLERTFNDPAYRGDPYHKVFLGAISSIVVGDQFLQVTQVREKTKEEKEKIAALMALAARNPENFKGYELPKLLEGRQILYLGNEKTTIHPKSGSTG